MYRPRRLGLPVVFLVMLVVFGACSSGTGTPIPASSAAPSTGQQSRAPTTGAPTGSASETPTAGAVGPSVSPPGQPGTDPTPTATSAGEAWRTAQLRDVRTGEVIRVADLAGRLVVIEPMAIWCTNCRAQQDAVIDVLAGLGTDRLTYISLDVDPNEIETDLARYADGRGYSWHFAVASLEMARSLAEVFGDQVLSPPSTPKIVVLPTGEASASFGFKSAPDLQAELAAHLP